MQYEAPSNLTTSYLIGTTEQTIYYSFSQYPCTYGALFEVELIEKGIDLDILESTNDDLPSFLEQASRDGQMQIYSTDRDTEGFYLFKVTSTLDNLALLENVNNLFTVTIDPENPPDDLLYNSTFFITLEMIDPQDDYIELNNTKPFFLPEPKDMYTYVGEAFEHSFGVARDYESAVGQSISVAIDLGEASAFAEFNYGTNTLYIVEGASADVTGNLVYTITLTLKDDYEDEFLGDQFGTTQYTFKLQLIRRGSDEDLKTATGLEQYQADVAQ